MSANILSFSKARNPITRVHRCLDRAAGPTSRLTLCAGGASVLRYSPTPVHVGCCAFLLRYADEWRYSSCSRHHVVTILYGLGTRGNPMLVHHVPSPVIFPGKRLAALPRIGALMFCAVELPSLLVLVVDVAIQMRLGAKPHGATRVYTLMWSVMVAFVVTNNLLATIPRETIDSWRHT